MNAARVSNFFIETRAASYSESLDLSWLSVFAYSWVLFLKGQNRKEDFAIHPRYLNTSFRYNRWYMQPQTPAVSYILVSHVGGLHCRSKCTRLRFAGNAVQMYILCGRLLPFWRSQRKLPPQRCHEDGQLRKRIVWHQTVAVVWKMHQKYTVHLDHYEKSNFSAFRVQHRQHEMLLSRAVYLQNERCGERWLCGKINQ